MPCTQCQKSQRSCRYVAEGEAGSLSDTSDAETLDRAPKRSCASVGQEGNLLDAHSQASTALLEDYGMRIERLEQALLEKTTPFTERSSGYRSHRPVASALTMRGLTVKGGSRTRFFGPSSVRVLVNLFDEAKEFMFSGGDSNDILQSFLLVQKIHKAMQEEYRKATSPITVYVDSMTPIHKRMTDVLPSKIACDHLVKLYMDESETLYRVLHIPSFMAQYNQYWEGNQQPDYFLPQLLSILCVGYRFHRAGKGQFQNDREGIHTPTACALVRAWLDSLRGKQLVEFSSLQTEVLALMAQRVLSTQSHEAWQHLGLLVRMAMTMGLHRDPSEFSHKILPFWAEQRRKLWTTILELDIHMSIQCNLPSCIREGDFTCGPPRNLNDDELYPNMIELPESKPIEVDTDSRIQVFAALTLRTRFKAVDLVNRVDNLQDYQQIIDIGNELEQALEDIRCVLPQRHLSNMNGARRQLMTRVLLDMNCRRPLLALYRPFALSSTDAPQQIMTGYLKSCMILLSYLEEVNPSTPEFTRIWPMHHFVLKRDIIYASFGVCYYMKQIQSSAGNTRDPETPESSARSDPIEVACTTASRSLMLLSLPRLRATVEKVIDTMIKRISEIGTDLKDLVSLTIVFYTYQGETRDPKKEVQQALQRIVDAGLQSVHISQENISSMTMMPPTEHIQMVNFQTDPNLINHAEPYNMLTADMQHALWGDFGMGDGEFWNPFITNQTPI
ncbi:fungal-specific transcription factor domain-containing protein [Xylaria bambusicola]|uniref:fungal-specific transcription factor domain-containing protein n=1 Tax=Xylaria bambusicola TaxID=326684 RepID=UPI0020074D05|nr:fungal-specific transcription factor domain-containing protein [Xylaria bambusicola]KAI0508287.1 fungal-specific transcription factor domain-containing protein [Xylaria bambusicola]